MKYISICSGIEAASTAWHGLGWTPLAFSEIEPFPSAVLAQRYHEVPNLGDMSKYREWPEEMLAECELLVGGTPCQAFSVAGLRKSLDDDRGNLSLIYVQMFHHINEIRRKHGRSPAIALWENVPGVLSTKDNAFGCFISGLLGVDDTLETQDGKWPKAGFLGSETVRVGYRVLDAQYFAVAQRRRRVFLVAVPCELIASVGERACPSEILSLRESVLGNPPTRGEARQAVARISPGSAASGGEPYHLDRAIVNAQYEPQITDDGVAAVMWNASDQANAERLVDQAGTLNCNKGQRGGWIAPSVAFGGNRTSGPLDVATSCLANGSPHGRMDFASETFVVDNKAMAVRTAQTSANGHGVACEVAHTLDQVQGQAVAAPIDLRESIGFNWQIGGGYGNANDGLGITQEGTPIIPVAFTKAKRAQSVNDDESWVPGEVAPTQNQFDVGDTRATTVVAFQKSDNDGAFAFSHSADANSHGIACVADGSPPIRGGGGGNSMPAVCRPSAMQVRRLTPLECCRLQGFPDDHCDVTFRKKPAADGPKYRALGNSMAVPCMAWLGYRIHLGTRQDA